MSITLTFTDEVAVMVEWNGSHAFEQKSIAASKLGTKR